MASWEVEREVAVSSPLGEDVLLFHRMTATEALGRLFECKLELLSEDFNLRLEDILGQNMTVRLNLGEGEERFFNGFASQFCCVGGVAHFARYQVTLRPRL